jgi:inositol transporter-like SP family MFS transporter
MASLLDSAAIISVGSALPLWRGEYRLDDWEVGFVSFALTLSIALGALVGGRVSDRVGRAPVFSATVGLYAVAAVLVALAQQPATLYAGVVLLGLASGADLPASLGLVSDRAPVPTRGRLIALTHVMWTVGIVLASALALVVSPFGASGMRLVFGVLAVAGVVTVVGRRRAARAMVDEPRPPLVATAAPTYPSRAVLRPAVLIGVFYVVYTLVANTFGSFRTYFLVVVGGATQSTATAIAFAVTLLGLAGTVVFSRIADTPWRRRVFPAGAVLLVGSQVLIAVSGGASLTVVLVALVLYSLAYPFVGESLYKVWTQELVGAGSRGTVQGTTIALARAAAGAFAVVTPTLMSWSPHVLFGFLAVCALASSAVGAVIMRRPVPGG